MLDSSMSTTTTSDGVATWRKPKRASTVASSSGESAPLPHAARATSTAATPASARAAIWRRIARSALARRQERVAGADEDGPGAVTHVDGDRALGHARARAVAA